MRLNKIILPIALITPLFASSCDKGGTYSGVTIDAQEMIYAYSQICSTTLTISDGLSGVEFVDDFKGEYFTFDNPNDIKGKTYTVNKTSSKKLTVTFVGPYTGVISQTESKEIKYKISKSAFKNNKVINDATGKMAMKCDGLRVTRESSDIDKIEFDCQFTFGTGGTDLTKIAISPALTQISDIALTKYCTQSGLTGNISFSKKTVEGKTLLSMSLTGLPNTGQHGFSFNIHNITEAIVFDNLSINYGLKFDISREDDPDSTYSLQSWELFFESVPPSN